MNFFLRPLEAMWRKELRHVLSSPAVLFSILLFLFGAGIPYLFPSAFDPAFNLTIRQYTVRIPYISVIIIPALTMGLWTDERKTGTYQLLFLYPVSDMLLVTGKFLSLLTVYLFMLTLTLPVVVGTFLIDTTSLPDIGAVFSAYLLLVLYGCLSLAVGQLISSLMKSSSAAFLSTVGVLFFFNTSHFIPHLASLPQWAVIVCTRLSFAWHFEAASRGILDSRDILFYLLLAASALYLNVVHIHLRRKQP